MKKCNLLKMHDLDSPITSSLEINGKTYVIDLIDYMHFNNFITLDVMRHFNYGFVVYLYGPEGPEDHIIADIVPINFPNPLLTRLSSLGLDKLLTIGFSTIGVHLERKSIEAKWDAEPYTTFCHNFVKHKPNIKNIQDICDYQRIGGVLNSYKVVYSYLGEDLEERVTSDFPRKYFLGIRNEVWSISEFHEDPPF